MKHFFVSAGKAQIRKRVMRMKFVLVLLALLAVVVSSAGCGTAAAASTKTTKTTTSAVSSTPRTTTTVPTTPKTTTTPALSTTSFNLALISPQTYAEYTLPVYLTSASIINLVWTVSGVGEHIRMAINTPEGKLVGVKTNGGFITLTSDDPCDQLNRSGTLILNPSTQKWLSGYYVFHLYICDQDPQVTVKLMYWIQQ